MSVTYDQPTNAGLSDKIGSNHYNAALIITDAIRGTLSYIRNEIVLETRFQILIRLEMPITTALFS